MLDSVEYSQDRVALWYIGFKVTDYSKLQAFDFDYEMAENKHTKTKKWSQKFKTEYSLQYPFIRKSERGIHHAFCTVCSVDISVEHGVAMIFGSTFVPNATQTLRRRDL